MPLPNVHSLSTAVAGLVIAAYWAVYFVTLAVSHTVDPSGLERAMTPDQTQACKERDTGERKAGGVCVLTEEAGPTT